MVIGLRERGIYKTRDGREFVAHAGLLGNYHLYSLRGGACVFPALAVDVTGRIVWERQPSRWRGEQLPDTGRTLLQIFATQQSVRPLAETGLCRSTQYRESGNGGSRSRGRRGRG